MDELKLAFEGFYGHPPAHIVRAPGRVNLIGEHTDYNDGFVLPMAIDLEVRLAVRPRPDRIVHLIALDQEPGETEFLLDDPRPDPSFPWSNYVRGIAAHLQARGHTFPGCDAVIHGNLPLGVGLSSSAALLVGAATAFETLGGFLVEKVELAKLCQRAENEFTGVLSGIMDQFISILGREDAALLIDCRDLSYRHVPLPAGTQVIVCNSMQARALAGSAYNARRAECEAAVGWLAARLGRSLQSLRDVSPADLAPVEAEMPSVLARRARHVVTENARVLQAVAAAEADDSAGFGRLMNASHVSLRQDYEVSSAALDTLVEIALAQPGVLGARLTGAGFGGCTVNLVERLAAPSAAPAIAREYQARSGLEPEIWIVRASAGAGLLN